MAQRRIDDEKILAAANEIISLLRAMDYLTSIEKSAAAIAAAAFFDSIMAAEGKALTIAKMLAGINPP
jgi:hypothetical protein